MSTVLGILNIYIEIQIGCITWNLRFFFWLLITIRITILIYTFSQRTKKNSIVNSVQCPSCSVRHYFYRVFLVHNLRYYSVENKITIVNNI